MSNNNNNNNNNVMSKHIEVELKAYRWYHGPLGREDANSKLQGQPLGSFLVRKRLQSTTEYVLTVTETHKITHYIITDVNGLYFKIGEQRFADIPSIVEFYKHYMLDTTALTTPVLRPNTQRQHSSNGTEQQQQQQQQQQQKPSTPPQPFQVRAKFKFAGSGDVEDLPFEKGDVLTVLKKEEEKWWLAKDGGGRQGMIPVPYVEIVPTTW